MAVGAYWPHRFLRPWGVMGGEGKRTTIMMLGNYGGEEDEVILPHRPSSESSQRR